MHITTGHIVSDVANEQDKAAFLPEEFKDEKF